MWLEGPQNGIPIVGAPSASARVAHRTENRGGYNMFQIDGEAGTWQCMMIAREYGADGKVTEVARENLLPHNNLSPQGA